MISTEQVVFNFVFNSIFSFLGGAVLVWITLYFFRITESRWKLLFFSIPWIKIFWDLLVWGIPASSILYAGVNPFSLPPKSQTLVIGGGFSNGLPCFLNILFLFTATTPEGKTYSTSIADYLFFLGQKHFGNLTFSSFFVFILGMSFFLLTRRFFCLFYFEKKRKNHRKKEFSVSNLRLGFRKVDVYVSSYFHGTPFTGGIFYPYICIPQDSFHLLTQKERDAVIQHELGHIEQWHLLGRFLTQVLTDLFWFIPFYPYFLNKKMDQTREFLADEFAIKRGVAIESLVSALLRLQSYSTEKKTAQFFFPFFREQKFLSFRIEKILNPSIQNTSRFGWQYLWMRYFIAFFILGAVLFSRFGGNHEVSIGVLSSWVDLFPFGLGYLLKKGGLFLEHL